MTQQELKSKILKKYHIGQVLNLTQRTMDGRDVIRKFKAEIVKFYPFHVSCIVGGNRESYTYWDMVKMTRRGRKGASGY